MKRILFLWYSAMWDRIASIPYLLKMKEKWVEVFLLEYEEWYMTYYSKKKDVYDLMIKNNLYKDVFVIPYNKIKLIFKLLQYIFRYVHSFDEVYAPVKTIATWWWWFIFWKKWRYTFRNLNDNVKYDNIVSWIMNNSSMNFYSYKDKLLIPYSKEYKNLINVETDFVTIFVGPYTRSIWGKERQKVFKYLTDSGFSIILLWWEEREWWIREYTNNNPKIIDLLWKTSFNNLCSILQDAKFTISANWWVMWLSHLLNKRSISFSITSWKITHPPVDNITSFHISNDKCKNPCEWWVSKEMFEKFGYKNCIYKWDNCIIKDNLTAIKVIELIKNNYLKNLKY